MRIEIEVSEKNEGTDSPWWVIIDPRQNFCVGERGIYTIASMITGPYFSRESAQCELDTRSYDYSRYARVFCMTGCHSGQYRRAIKEQ